MLGPFINYFIGIINGTINLMGSMDVVGSGITVLAIALAGIFVYWSFDLIN